ncbi:MAG: transcription termination factor Rho, partial [Lachnospiraceae bacterium]|nr:transcription termination factor Rho [Lachnospiraceae bacterium]
MRERYESICLADLKEMAKNRGIKIVSGMKKADIVDAMLAKDQEESREASKEAAKKEEMKKEEARPQENKRPEYKKPVEGTEKKPSLDATLLSKEELAELDSGYTASGILEVMPDGFGFIRCENFLPGDNDVYVAPSQIRRFGLKTGDILEGNTRVKTQNEKFRALLYLTTINGYSPEEATKRYNFEDMTPIFPNRRIQLEAPGAPISMRIMDLISPVGKGQRGMIVSPPKAGKTTLLKDVAKSIKKTNPDMHMIILLIDERPEEVTDMKEEVEGPNVEVIYSTFDETPEHHKRVSEMVIERAKRLVELKKDVTILLDSITRLTRAYNLTVPPSGRTLSGGLDPAALHMPKRFFGAA